MFRPRSFVVAFAAAIFVGGAAAAQTSHYHVVKTIEIGAARADYLIIDPVGGAGSTASATR